MTLAPLRAHDASLVFDDLRDPTLYRYIVQSPPKTLADTTSLFTRWAGGSTDPDAIWLNWIGYDPRVTGAVGLYQATILPAQHLALIGYIIFRRFQGRGYAREGVRAMVQHMADRDDIGTMRAEISEANTASIAVVTALHFKLRDRNEGEGRDGERACDDLVYELRV